MRMFHVEPLLEPAAPVLESGAPPVAPAVTEPKPTEPKAEEMPGFAAFASEHFKETVDPAQVKKDIEAAKGAPAKKVEAKRPTPKPKPVAVASKAEPALTADQIAEAAARGVATAMKATPAENKEPAPDPRAELPADERERVEVLQQMERMNPTRYKGLADRYAKAYTESAKQLKKYADDWEQEHPGEKFDENAAEHEDFMEKISVNTDWDDTHFHKAAGALGAAAVVSEQGKKTQAALDEINHKELMREAQTGIATAQLSAAKLLWKSFGKDFDGVITADGAVDKAKLEALGKSDPEGHKVRLQTISDLNFEVQELHKLMDPKLKYSVRDKPPEPGDPQFGLHSDEYQCHKALAEFASQQEKAIAAKAPEEQLDGQGRSFVPATKYWRLSKAERESNHWTFTEADLTALRAVDRAVNAQKFIAAEQAKSDAYAISRGWIKPEETGQRAQKTPEQVLAEAAQTEPKPETPSSDSASRLAATREAGKLGGEDGLSYFGRRHMGVAS